MSTPPRIAVTGSTGALGGQVAREIAAWDIPQRLLARDASRAPVLPYSEVAVAPYADADAAVEALHGIEVLFMVSAAESADRLDQHRRFVDAAAEAGVRHVVYTSFLAADPDATFTLAREHFHTEEHIQASGIGYTFLRDNFYLDVFPYFVGEDGVLRGPAGEGRVSAVAREDIARCALAVLTDPEPHLGATYDLTGPEALTMAEVAAVISTAQGREVVFHDETVEEAYESRRRWEAPQWQYDAWVSTYTAIKAGELDAVSEDVRRLTGRRPLTLAQLLSAPEQPGA